MTSNPINILTIQFADEISNNELTAFRGAVINSMTEAPLLFHNHLGEKFRYAYPLVQYKRINRKAAIVCIGKEACDINELLKNSNINFHIRHEDREIHIESCRLDFAEIGIVDNMLLYRLKNWLPLNSNNYAIFQNTESLTDKIELLEKILIGNILSLLKGVGIQLKDKILLNITNISNKHLTSYKDIKLVAFDVDFKANINLPQYIGIGKNASIGYGVLRKKDSPRRHKSLGES